MIYIWNPTGRRWSYAAAWAEWFIGKVFSLIKAHKLLREWHWTGYIWSPFDTWEKGSLWHWKAIQSASGLLYTVVGITYCRAWEGGSTAPLFADMRASSLKFAFSPESPPWLPQVCMSVSKALRPTSEPPAVTPLSHSDVVHLAQ